MRGKHNPVDLLLQVNGGTPRCHSQVASISIVSQTSAKIKVLWRQKLSSSLPSSHTGFSPVLASTDVDWSISPNHRHPRHPFSATLSALTTAGAHTEGGES